MTIRQFGNIHGDVVAWFIDIGWVVALGSITGLLGSLWFYVRRR
jgi:hypothetical protein